MSGENRRTIENNTPITLLTGDTIEEDGLVYLRTGEAITGTFAEVWQAVKDKATSKMELAYRQRQQREESERLERERQDRLAELAAAIHLTPEQREAIAVWHDAWGWQCAAESEGQTCCVDRLLEQ